MAEYKPLEEALAELLAGIAEDMGVDPTKLLKPELSDDDRLMLGRCPKCDVRLEPNFSLPHLLVCPSCHRWYSKSRVFHSPR